MRICLHLCPSLFAFLNLCYSDVDSSAGPGLTEAKENINTTDDVFKFFGTLLNMVFFFHFILL